MPHEEDRTARRPALAGSLHGQAREVQRVLEDQGYTDIVIGGADPWGCGKEDSTSNKFTAKGPTGRQVRGVVCGTGGWTKGYTVRVY